MSQVQASSQLLELNVISAQDLAPVSRNMRTYAVSWVHPDRKLSTRVDTDGLTHPTWNDKFVFRVDEDFLYSETSAIMIEIYALHWFKDIHVGTVRVLIGNLAPPPSKPLNNKRNPHGMRFLAVQVRRPSGRPQGILNIGFTVLDSSMRSMPLYTHNPSAVGYRHLMGEKDAYDNHNHLRAAGATFKAEMRRTKSESSSMIDPKAVVPHRAAPNRVRANSAISGCEAGVKKNRGNRFRIKKVKKSSSAVSSVYDASSVLSDTVLPWNIKSGNASPHDILHHNNVVQEFHYADHNDIIQEFHYDDHNDVVQEFHYDDHNDVVQEFHYDDHNDVVQEFHYDDHNDVVQEFHYDDHNDVVQEFHYDDHNDVVQEFHYDDHNDVVQEFHYDDHDDVVQELDYDGGENVVQELDYDDRDEDRDEDSPDDYVSEMANSEIDADEEDEEEDEEQLQQQFPVVNVQYEVRPSPKPQFRNSPAPHYMNSPAPQFKNSPAPHYKSSPAPHYKSSPAPHYKSSPAPQYKSSPAPHYKSSPAPQFKNSPAPQFMNSPVPQFKNSPKPQLMNSPAPQFKNSPKPQFMNSPKPQFQNSPKPQFMNSPKPQFQNSPKPHFMNSPKPQFQNSPKPQFMNSPKPQFRNSPAVGVAQFRASPAVSKFNPAAGYTSHRGTPMHPLGKVNGGGFEYMTPRRSNLAKMEQQIVITESELGPSPSEVAAAIARKPMIDEGENSIVGGWSLDAESVEGLESKLQRWRTDLPAVVDHGELSSYPTTTASNKTSNKSSSHSRRHTDGGNGLFSCFSKICGVECYVGCGDPKAKKNRNPGTTSRARTPSLDGSSSLP